MHETPKQKKDRRRTQAKALYLEFGIYLFCFLGIGADRFIPDLTVDVLSISFPNFGELLSTLILTLVIVRRAEKSGDIAGKRARFFRRAKSAFLVGFFAMETMSKVPWKKLMELFT